MVAGRPVPPAVAELFWNTGTLLREIDRWLLQNKGAGSVLARALLESERGKLEQRLGRLEEALRAAYDAELAHLPCAEVDCPDELASLVERYDSISYLTRLLRADCGEKISVICRRECLMWEGPLCPDQLRPRQKIGAQRPLPHWQLRSGVFLANMFICSLQGRRTFCNSSRQNNAARGLTPSTREIQEHFGFASQTSVMQYLAALERKGFLQRHARKARALITAAPHSRVVDIPIYGEIPAGHGNPGGTKHRGPRGARS